MDGHARLLRTVAKHAVYCVPALLVTIWILTGDDSITAKDSQGYIDFAPLRTAGYPLFIAAVTAVVDNLYAVIVAQALVFGLALCVLGWSVLKASGSALLAAIAVVVAGANPYVVEYHRLVLSESLFMSLSVVMVAMALLMFLRARLRWIVVAATAAGVAVAVRPAGYAFLPLIPIIMLLAWPAVRRRPLAFAAAAIAPVVLILVAEQAVYSGSHDGERPSLLWPHLFAKSGLGSASVENPFPEGDERAPIWDGLEHGLVPLRDLIKASDTFSARHFLILNAESFVQYGFEATERKDAATALGISRNRLEQEVGLARISAAPFAFVGLTLHHYRALWTPYAGYELGTAVRLRDDLAAYAEPESRAAFEGALSRVEPKPHAYLIQAVMLGLWAGSVLVAVLGTVLWLFRPISPVLRGAITASLMVNGYFLLVAMTAAGLPRYAVPMWPAIAVCTLLTAWSVAGAFAPRLLDRLALAGYRKAEA